MKTFAMLSFAALMLVTTPAASYAGEDKKNTAQNHAATANQQLSIKLLRLRLRPQPPQTFTPVINQ